MDWRDALMRLHVSGWDTDDIDAACETIGEACSDGPLAGTRISDLTARDVARLLGSEPDPSLLPALFVIAELRTLENADAQELTAALFDLDAFAYEYAGDV